MKHIKTFESFSHVNEELWDKLKTAVKGKGVKLSKEEVAKKIEAAFASKKNDPKLQSLLAKLASKYKSLSGKDRQTIDEFKVTTAPEIPETPEDQKIETASVEDIVKMSESVSMISEGVVTTILKYIGLSSAAIGFVLTVFAVVKYIGLMSMVLAGGLSLGTLATVAIAMFIGGGLLAGVAHIAGDPELDEKPKSMPRRK
jgi:hypothetical protein